MHGVDRVCGIIVDIEVTVTDTGNSPTNTVEVAVPPDSEPSPVGEALRPEKALPSFPILIAASEDRLQVLNRGCGEGQSLVTTPWQRKGPPRLIPMASFMVSLMAFFQAALVFGKLSSYGWRDNRSYPGGSAPGVPAGGVLAPQTPCTSGPGGRCAGLGFPFRMLVKQQCQSALKHA